MMFGSKGNHMNSSEITASSHALEGYVIAHRVQFVLSMHGELSVPLISSLFTHNTYNHNPHILSLQAVLLGFFRSTPI